MICRILLMIIIFFPGFIGCAQDATCFPESTPSFFKLVGKTNWKLSLKDFAVSLEKDGKVFELRVQGRHYLRYSAHLKGVSDSNQFGPLQHRHAAELSRLLEYALFFAEQEKNDEFAIDVNWQMYPQSIQKWAKIWQDSDLRKKWDGINQHARYQKLMNMIADFMKEDMQTLAQGLGFEATGASMEKMNFQKAKQLKYYDEVLEPAGIPCDLKIPIPLMLSVLLKPSRDASAAQDPKPKSTCPVIVDYIFATARSNAASVYCSFRRSLDEYEITGDLNKPDGTYAGILPISQKEYRSIATRLLRASLRVTRGDERKTFSLRINLKLYPEVYQEVVERFTLSRQVTQKTGMPRPELQHLQFYEYEPLPASGFQAAINPFLEQNGYRFRYLQISVDSKHKATSYPEYEKEFKPLGIKPDDKLVIPDIVYMVVEKK